MLYVLNGGELMLSDLLVELRSYINNNRCKPDAIALRFDQAHRYSNLLVDPPEFASELSFMEIPIVILNR